MKRTAKNTKKNQILSVLIYCLPIIFFIISYFLITTSCEDIYQGAGRLSNGFELNAINDMKAAFNHSGRIPDMYAWSVIDLFDYQFKFGIDTIFRIIDVIAITGVLLLTTYIILGRKPKLQIKDSLIFCSVFVAIIFSMFGRRLYTEFSMIHNYVFLVLVTLIFSIPYLKLLFKKEIKDKHHLLTILWLPTGIIFGMSTTITPLAFLLTAIIYLIIKRPKLKNLPAWFYTGLIGLIIGFCISFFGGQGMNDYTSGANAIKVFDYISLSDFFQNPIATLPRLFFHAVYNFGILLLPLIIIAIIAMIFSKTFRQVFNKHPLKSLSPNTKTLLLTFSIFIFIHTIATIQIKTQPRILIPAYIAGVIMIFKIFASHIKSRLLNVGVITLAIVAIIAHTVFLSIYHVQAGKILNEIKNSPSNSICIEPSRVIAARAPIINLSQEYMIVDWGYPEPIYGKDVTLCQTN